jgi:hypothetical protein
MGAVNGNPLVFFRNVEPALPADQHIFPFGDFFLLLRGSPLHPFRPLFEFQTLPADTMAARGLDSRGAGRQAI